MDIVETVYPFILVKPTSYWEINGVEYAGKIAVQTNQGPMLAARVEKFQNGKGGGGFRAVLLTPEDIKDEQYDWGSF